ncbi:MAG: class I SAM-dependent methyltransferase [Elusimicrobia bacterium]|nr:class I SAM-dependent methyltransferase [Elusimicrobiota bacterium]
MASGRDDGTGGAKAVARFYHDRIRRFGVQDPRCLGLTRASQRARFRALCELGDFDRKRVLDAGCGLGDLLPFLLERGVRPFYCGLDLCPEMIAHCRKRFRTRPDLACHFEVGSVLDHQPPGPYDYVVASGLFGCFTPGATLEIESALAQMFSWCGSGLAVNFLSRRCARQEPGRLYVDPSEILQAALRITPRVRMRHDYLPNDFTLYLYPPQPEGTNDQRQR